MYAVKHNKMADDNQHFDCLIIGSGVCGIDTAYHVQKYSPWANYVVLERMANVGGTWEFFKYPDFRLIFPYALLHYI